MRRAAALSALLLAALLLAGCGAPQDAPAAEPTPEPLCAHDWRDGVCSLCGEVCVHDWAEGVCRVCGMVCAHDWAEGVCRVCGMVCAHDWDEGVCTICGRVCTHEDHDRETRECRVCGLTVPHRYVNCVCSCGARPQYVEDLKLYPEEVLVNEEGPGQIDSYVYNRLTGEIVEGDRKRNHFERVVLIYTPCGYDPEGAYDVVFLTNASNTNSAAWLTKGYSFDSQHCHFTGKKLLDGMIAQGYCEPTIFVSIEYRRNASPAKTAEMYERELRRDVLPFLIENYATYASLDENRRVIPAREHFAHTGASFGSTMSWELMTRCADLFSYWGLYSGRLSEGVPIVRAIDEAAAQYPLDFVYVGGGKGEPASGTFEKYTAGIIEDCVSLEEGKNIAFLNLDHAIHWHPTWFVLLHNSMQVFFRNRYEPLG